MVGVDIEDLGVGIGDVRTWLNLLVSVINLVLIALDELVTQVIFTCRPDLFVRGCIRLFSMYCFSEIVTVKCTLPLCTVTTSKIFTITIPYHEDDAFTIPYRAMDHYTVAYRAHHSFTIPCRAGDRLTII